ncbi:putative ankyrin repeat protein RF_0381 [Patella vulgata]|uniref:putative ankyrin repeat protein RF_0381 n=1 Tax=Patella vulgata TaxID=6465 RepID=UPI0021802268|nr:putative ankyrin repeat protein RF_0381 [Patella vulgata]
MDVDQSRIEEANRLNRIEVARAYLQQTPNSPENKRVRIEWCKEALRLRHLELTKLLYTDELIYDREGRLDDVINIELLSSAIESDFVEGFEFLLHRGLSFEITECGFWCALFEAVRKEKIGILKYLASFPVLCVLNSTFGETILMVACKNSNLEVFSILLKHQNVKDVINYISLDEGLSVLHLCIDWANCETTCLLYVMMLVEAGADVNILSNEFITPLFTAARRGFMSVLSYLVDHGAHVSVPDLNLYTVLHHIITKPNTILFVQKLIKAGLEINLQNKLGETSLYLATKYRNGCAVKILLNTNGCDVNLSDKKGITPLLLAVEQNDIEIFKLLHHHGATVKKQNSREMSVLHLAIQNGNAGIVDILLYNHGCDVNLSDKVGVTPLLLAVEQNEIEIVTLLQTHGADVNKQNSRGMSPLHLAIKKGSKHIVDILLNNHSCDVNLSDKEGITPLLLAVEQNEIEIVTLLQIHGADVNKQNSRGMSPLHLAIKKGSKHIVDILLNDHSCDVNLSDKEGITPLLLAVNIRNTELIKRLLEHGVDVNKLDDDGRSAICYCFRDHGLSYWRFFSFHEYTIEILKLLESFGMEFRTQNRGNKLVKNILKIDKIEYFQHLVDSNKIDYDDIDENGDNILHLLARELNIDTISRSVFLNDEGVDVNLINSAGDTPLMVAAVFNNVPYMKALLDYGCKTDTQNYHGHTALHLCVVGIACCLKNGYFGEHECLDAALCKDVDVDVQDNEGRTALILAAKFQQVNLVKRLLIAGGDVKILDKSGKSVLEYMDFYRIIDLKICKCIMRSGGVNVRDRTGSTMMDCALDFFFELHQLSDAQEMISYLVAANYCLKNNGSYYFDQTEDSTSNIISDFRKLLYESGAEMVDIVSKLNFLLDKDKDMDTDKQTSESLSKESEFHSFCNNLSLKSMCRRVIRQHLGSNIQEKVKQLKLPIIIQNFILLKSNLADKYFSLETGDCDDDDEDDVWYYYDGGDYDDDVLDDLCRHYYDRYYVTSTSPSPSPSSSSSPSSPPPSSSSP